MLRMMEKDTKFYQLDFDRVVQSFVDRLKRHPELYHPKLDIETLSENLIAFAHRLYARGDSFANWYPVMLEYYWHPYMVSFRKGCDVDFSEDSKLYRLAGKYLELYARSR